MWPYLIALVALFAVADRFAGGPFVERLHWRGRPVWYATVALALSLIALDWCAHDRPVGWGWFALAWFVWREPQWRFAGGDLTVETFRVGLGFFLRHLFFLGAAVAAWAAGRDPVWSAALVAVWALLAVLLGVWLARERDQGRDVNGIVETTRGALQGAAVAAILLV